MSEFIVRKASRSQKKLRINLSASSGSGKTLGALLLAFGMTGDWSKILVVDSERKSSALYVGDTRFNIGEFDHIDFQEPYSPERYVNILREFHNNYDVIIMDSISHEWYGNGGCLEIHNKLGGRFQDWGKVTPRHNKFVDTICNANCHVIVTSRRKEAHAMEADGQGKQTVVKKGMDQIQRNDFDYELDIVLEIDNSTNLAKPTKNRTDLFKSEEEKEFLISVDTGKQLLAWCQKGISNIDKALDLIREAESKEHLSSILRTYSELKTNQDFIGAIKAAKIRLGLDNPTETTQE